jgi:hypothetical protein
VQVTSQLSGSLATPSRLRHVDRPEPDEIPSSSSLPEIYPHHSDDLRQTILHFGHYCPASFPETAEDRDNEARFQIAGRLHVVPIEPTRKLFAASAHHSEKYRCGQYGLTRPVVSRYKFSLSSGLLTPKSVGRNSETPYPPDHSREPAGAAAQSSGPILIHNGSPFGCASD